MTMNDVLLAAVLNTDNLVSSRSFIDTCFANNIEFARDYDPNIYQHRAIPSKRLAIVCCMDGRLDLYRMLGLKPGEAHIIRNGGSRLRDAIRSLVCSQTLFQTKELMIIHNTDCEFTYFTNNDQVLASLMVRAGQKSNDLPFTEPFYSGDKPDFMPIIDIEQSIRDDLNEYKQHPMLNQNIIVRGFLCDTKTGLLKEVHLL